MTIVKNKYCICILLPLCCALRWFDAYPSGYSRCIGFENTLFISRPVEYGGRARFTACKNGRLVQYSLSCTSLSCKSHSCVRPIGKGSFRILYMASYGRSFSLVRPSQFHVQIFESRPGRTTGDPTV